MLFNSLDFAIFLPIVFLIYWLLANRTLNQNLFLLLASYLFYGLWDYRFLSLLLISSTMDFFLSKRLDAVDKPAARRILLIISIVVNLSLLGFFKYYNFFVDSFTHIFSFFGVSFRYERLKIILPVGISFYTFQSMGYIIDVYFKKIKATHNMLAYFTFVAFFPQLVAGPISRAPNLLPQFHQKRVFDFDKAKDGLRQMLWGLFKKIVIADNCAKMADGIFANSDSIHGPVLFLGAFYFAIQIYADFSGYSDIAIGCARLFGFSLMRNFNFPYFSKNIAEFWKRWHISLTSWFRDYLFLPLSVAVSRRFNKEKVLFMKTDLFIYIVASIVTWFLTGLWHGANYTFIAWGMIHGFFLILYQWQKQPRKILLKKIGLKNSNFFIVFFETVLTLIIVLFAWIFFRSDSIRGAFQYIQNMFSLDHVSFSFYYLGYLPLAFIMLMAEWVQRDKQHVLETDNSPVYLRWAGYFAVLILIFMFGVSGSRSFIYFQF
jgi:alginate O-acetyltransferase complex protein AlgI